MVKWNWKAHIDNKKLSNLFYKLLSLDLLSVSDGLRIQTVNAIKKRNLKQIAFFWKLARPRGIEPRLPPWKGDVLTARRWARINLVAHPERFERPTLWFVARYSIQLSYGCILITSLVRCESRRPNSIGFAETCLLFSQIFFIFSINWLKLKNIKLT